MIPDFTYHILDNGNLVILVNTADGRSIIGALTQAPIITDFLGLLDDGPPQVPNDAKLWWFPNYAVEDPLQTLLDKGQVVFMRVHR